MKTGVIRSVFDRRQKLSDIVFSTRGRFTVDDVVNKYVRVNGSPIVDGLLSIESFLESLEELGRLERFSDYYTLVQ